MSLELHLKPNPAALEISHAEPGTNVSLDGAPVGQVPRSGTLISEVAPGQHSVELTREGFTAKEFVRFFNSGEAATLTGRDVELQIGHDLGRDPPRAQLRPRKVRLVEHHDLDARLTQPLCGG